MDFFLEDSGNEAAAATTAPQGFVTIAEYLPARIERKLGYRGDSRFVMFYYEPRGDEVFWKDGLSYGFGQGGWCTYLQRIVPLANQYEVDLGNSDHAGTHALLLDLYTRRAYFAERAAAERFVIEQSAATDPTYVRPADLAAGDTAAESRPM